MSERRGGTLLFLENPHSLAASTRGLQLSPEMMERRGNPGVRGAGRLQEGWSRLMSRQRTSRWQPAKGKSWFRSIPGGRS